MVAVVVVVVVVAAVAVTVKVVVEVVIEVVVVAAVVVAVVATVVVAAVVAAVVVAVVVAVAAVVVTHRATSLTSGIVRMRRALLHRVMTSPSRSTSVTAHPGGGCHCRSCRVLGCPHGPARSWLQAWGAEVQVVHPWRFKLARRLWVGLLGTARLKGACPM